MFSFLRVPFLLASQKERQAAAGGGLEGAEEEPEMAAMMGFAGFGGSAVK